MRHFCLAVWAALLLIPDHTLGVQGNIFVIETEGRYLISARGAKAIAKQMAVFIAKREAVNEAGRSR